MNAALDPAVSRFSARQRDNEDEAELWRGKLQAYRNLYGFLSQVIPYQDSGLEKLYVFLRHLGAKLPRRRGGPAYQFDDDVRLEKSVPNLVFKMSINCDSATGCPANCSSINSSKRQLPTRASSWQRRSTPATSSSSCSRTCSNRSS